MCFATLENGKVAAAKTSTYMDRANERCHKISKDRATVGKNELLSSSLLSRTKFNCCDYECGNFAHVPS
jgi:hypothetical protein